jgi:predicted DNA binding CopG/RHH family protein
LKDYDFEKLPELDADQISAFSRVKRARHSELKKAVVKSVGRPRKKIEDKENVISIRFSKSFLDRIKKKAKVEGYSKWQTYAKHILEENIK